MSWNANLRQETLAAVEDSQHTVSDVWWVGSADGNEAMTWDQFCAVSDAEYHAGYGAVEVRPDLVLVFHDGTWLEREEYDGAEGWSFKQKPILEQPFPGMRYIFQRDAPKEQELR